MSVIRIFQQQEKPTILEAYKEVLKHYIDKVLKKIGENDNNITWYICKKEDFPIQIKPLGLLKLEQLSGIIMKPVYGCTKYDKNNKCSDIYVSTTAIQSAPFPLQEIVENLGLIHNSENLLINVILDELAHAKTFENHGSPEYDNTLEKYAYLYYG